MTNKSSSHGFQTTQQVIWKLKTENCHAVWNQYPLKSSNQRGANSKLSRSFQSAHESSVTHPHPSSLDCWIFRFHFRSSCKSFGRISNQMVRDESWDFQLTWCVVWNPCDDDLFVNFLLGAGPVRLGAFLPCLSTITLEWTFNAALRRFKVTRPSYFLVVPPYFEALWYPHFTFIVSVTHRMYKI